MRPFDFLISVVLALLWAGVATAEESTAADLSCDLNDEQTVDWAVMSQTVTLRTHIKSSGGDYPVGYLKLILADGDEIDLGEGTKYIDDAPDEVFGDCYKHLEVAKEATVESLSLASQFPTLESLWAYSAMGQDCMDSANLLEQEEATYNCLQAASVHESFVETSLESSLDFTEFERLLNSRSPLITIRRSAYYSETFVYDAQTNSLHIVLRQGC